MLKGFFPATAMPDPDWWEALWPRTGEVVAALGPAPGGEAVDLCCGDGLFTVPLARLARRVIAIDLDPALLDKARAQLATVGVVNCELVEGDAYAIAELVRRPADFVLIANTFHGVPEKGRLAGAVATVLKPGGRFAVVNWHRRPREETTILGQPRGPKTEMRMTPADVAAAVEPAGLQLVGIVELPPYHYGAIFEKPASAALASVAPLCIIRNCFFTLMGKFRAGAGDHAAAAAPKPSARRSPQTRAEGRGGRLWYGPPRRRASTAAPSGPADAI